ncbi:hypothetical protein CEXT_79141 [Caerostris extrusa]|uniref:Uncharacterized protein n=1 Tax=Caerostris extrusa TaxID=172846 RepID=A0AAV4NNG7_CAEEX|nr:hypothetical protein CEXT_79141 [Caerostris extrusa]
MNVLILSPFVDLLLVKEKCETSSAVSGFYHYEQQTKIRTFPLSVTSTISVIPPRDIKLILHLILSNAIVQFPARPLDLPNQLPGEGQTVIKE